MNKLLIILGLLILNYSLFADCGKGNISFWPEEKFISKNSIFMIEGRSGFQNFIKELNISRLIYLNCGNEKIKLNNIKIYEGQFNLSQCLLKPEKELTIGKSYEMIIEKSENEVKYFSNIPKWKVVNETDNQKPIWISEPVYLGHSYIENSCNPEKNIYFYCSVSDNSPTLIYTRVNDIKTNKYSEYLLKSKFDKITIGSIMCNGAFLFEDGHKYSLQLGFIDGSGNENLELTNKFEFISPKKELSNPDSKTNENIVKNINANYLNPILTFTIGVIIGIGLIKFIKRINASS